jgi:hypothetical protein
MNRTIAIMILVCVVSACTGGAKNEAIGIDQVPPNLLEIAKEKLPDVTFDQAVKKSNGVLEVRGKDKTGKVRDVEFSPKGEVVEIE